MRRLATSFLCLLLTACGDPGAGEPGAEPPPRESSTGDEGSEAPIDPGGEAPGGAAEGEMCGGIQGLACPGDQWCDLEGDYPDASGTCRPSGSCDAPADCEAQGLPHIMCVGGWVCENGTCGWECE
ncbi:MAG TPA: hypothetical protein RMH99_15075 [Sandaracinaceae bacterium LLY-WYZ-13_1]|nr:hypothetical protein [Sandaracinaceae bacterium LLY-WYZ-13_1]